MFQEEWKVTIDRVEQEVAERNQIVSSALGQQVECVSAGEDDVALESALLLHWDVLAVRVVVFLSEAKINYSNFMK